MDHTEDDVAARGISSSQQLMSTYVYSVSQDLLVCCPYLTLKVTGQAPHSCPSDRCFLALAEKDQAESDKAASLFLSTAEQLTSLRCQIIVKWEEIQAMEKEIKDTMTFAGIVSIREKTVKELEVRPKGAVKRQMGDISIFHSGGGVYAFFLFLFIIFNCSECM